MRVQSHPRFLGHFAKVQAPSFFLIIGESAEDIESTIFMLALRVEKPKACVVLQMLPTAGTIHWDIDSNVNMPWSLRMDRSGQQCLNFRFGLEFFCDFMERCRASQIEEIRARLLHGEAASVEVFKATGGGNMATLFGSALADLAAIQEPGARSSELAMT